MICLQLAREEEEKQMTLDEWKAKQAKKVLLLCFSDVNIDCRENQLLLVIYIDN